jgi:DNA polymerase-3 subunit epsilon
MPRFVRASDIAPSALAGCYGPFASKRGARELLRSTAAAHRLCWRRLELERRAPGPCFARQLRRCAGACVGAEPLDAHDARVAAVLAPYAIPGWPVAGIAIVLEASASRERVDAHLMRDWCWLGTARDDCELARLLDAPPPPSFDFDVARLLLGRHAKGKLRLAPAEAWRSTRT